MTHAQKAGSLIGCLFLFSIIFYFTVERQIPAVTTFTKPPAMAGVAKLPTDTVALPRGITAIKPEAVKKLGVKVRPDQHVTATATVPKSKGGYDIVSVTDDTGDTVLLTKEKPPALFSLEHSGRVGIGMGLDSRHGQTAKAFVEYSPITVLGLTLGVEGQILSHPTDADHAVSVYGGAILFKAF